MVFSTKSIVVLNAQVSVTSVFLLLKSVQASTMTRVSHLGVAQYFSCQ